VGSAASVFDPGIQGSPGPRRGISPSRSRDIGRSQRSRRSAGAIETASARNEEGRSNVVVDGVVRIFPDERRKTCPLQPAPRRTAIDGRTREP
jgi:hypothetical protein